MATRRLARSVHERGNTGRFQFLRRSQHRQYRHATKAYCRKVRWDPDRYDADIAPNVMQREPQEDFDWWSERHSCQTNVIDRWFARRVGCRWADVYHDIRKQFDHRTFAGQYVFEHFVRGYVDVDGGSRWYVGYVVDDDGVLRARADHAPQWWRRMRWPTDAERAEAKTWLDGRRVGSIGGSLFWFVETGRFRWTEVRQPLSYFEQQEYGIDCLWYFTLVPTYRQDRLLSRGEMDRFDSFTPTLQRELIALAPASDQE